MRVKIYLVEDGVRVVSGDLSYVVSDVAVKDCRFFDDHFDGTVLTEEDSSSFLATWSKAVDFSTAPSGCCFGAAQINSDGSHTIWAHSSTPFE